MEVKSVLWFRHGLRLHDNPALLEAIRGHGKQRVTFYPVFIFDGESAGTKLVGYNRFKFLTESLADLDSQFKKLGGPGLLYFQGNPTKIFKWLHDSLGINKICFEQDCEPIWRRRDSAVETLCRELGIEIVEKVSHTLWDPMDIINVNGGFAPLTYHMMLHSIDVLGPPPRPCKDADFTDVDFGFVPDELKCNRYLLTSIPTPENFSIRNESKQSEAFTRWYGGEKRALEQLQLRIKAEGEGFKNGIYLPNQANIDILATSSTSMSAALRFGCLSVRKFYYAIHEKFDEVQAQTSLKLPGGHHITGQLIWREYFYTMSVKNLNYGQMKDNPICLNIPWGQPKSDEVTRWKEGRTGIPIIDAAMRQLLAEGWLHHVLRNLLATFLTRTGMWLSWEVGFQHFLKYLLDADWSVCAGNWMWVSSSAFEKLLDSSKYSIIPLASRLDPNGEYIKRYVPELSNFPNKYIQQPWMAPLEIQQQHGCTLGQDYPMPMIDLTQASQANCERMKAIRASLVEAQPQPHIRPSNEAEIRTFFWMAEDSVIECN